MYAYVRTDNMSGTTVAKDPVSYTHLRAHETSV